MIKARHNLSILMHTALAIIFMFYSSVSCVFNNYVSCENGVVILHSLYGDFVLDGILAEIVQSPVMQRLKNVKQYGAYCYVTHPECCGTETIPQTLHDYKKPEDFLGIPDDYTRYDHSLGVGAWLIKVGAPEKEILAGFLHDASHTAGSHTGAQLFNPHENISRSAYQDDHHLEFLAHLGIEEILQKYDISLETIDPKQKCFTALEQELDSLSSICADRLEYTLNGGLRQQVLTREQVQAIAHDINFENDIWYFSTPELAKLFARTSLYLQLRVWASPENMVGEKLFIKALKRAIDLKILTENDIRFTTDDFVWNRLTSSEDAEITTLIQKLLSIRSCFVHDRENYDLHLVMRFRGIDPVVKTDNSYIKLTALDTDYCKEYNEVKEFMKQGWYVKFVN